MKPDLRKSEQSAGSAAGRSDPSCAPDGQGPVTLIGGSLAFLKAIAKIPVVIQADSAVLISGETGTGKELVARAIHCHGRRSSFPFVPVNCGSLVDTLLEDQLFGHERGAFTDANARSPGLLAQADGGTFFLDEIDALTPRAQMALLRVLQENRFRPSAPAASSGWMSGSSLPRTRLSTP